MAGRYRIGNFTVMVTGGGPTKGVATVRVHPDDLEAAKKLFSPSGLDEALLIAETAPKVTPDRLLFLAKKIHEKALSNQKLLRKIIGGKSKSVSPVDPVMKNGGSGSGSGSGSTTPQ